MAGWVQGSVGAGAGVAVGTGFGVAEVPGSGVALEPPQAAARVKVARTAARSTGVLHSNRIIFLRVMNMVGHAAAITIVQRNLWGDMRAVNELGWRMDRIAVVRVVAEGVVP